MSSNFNLNKQKCWSCEYFCGKRQIKNGLLMGTFVETDATGICCCKRGGEKEKRLARTTGAPNTIDGEPSNPCSSRSSKRSNNSRRSVSFRNSKGTSGPNRSANNAAFPKNGRG